MYLPEMQGFIRLCLSAYHFYFFYMNLRIVKRLEERLKVRVSLLLGFLLRRRNICFSINKGSIYRKPLTDTCQLSLGDGRSAERIVVLGQDFLFSLKKILFIIIAHQWGGAVYLHQ